VVSRCKGRGGRGIVWNGSGCSSEEKVDVADYVNGVTAYGRRCSGVGRVGQWKGLAGSGVREREKGW